MGIVGSGVGGRGTATEAVQRLEGGSKMMGRVLPGIICSAPTALSSLQGDRGERGPVGPQGVQGKVVSMALLACTPVCARACVHAHMHRCVCIW